MFDTVMATSIIPRNPPVAGMGGRNGLTGILQAPGGISSALPTDPIGFGVERISLRHDVSPHDVVVELNSEPRAGQSCRASRNAMGFRRS